MEAAKEVVAKGMTVKALIFGLIPVIIVSILAGHLFAYGNIGMGPAAIEYTMAASAFTFPWAASFLVTLVIALINKVKPGMFSIQEAVIIFTMVWVGLGAPINGIAGGNWPQQWIGTVQISVVAASEADFNLLWNNMPAAWGIRDLTAIRALLQPGMPKAINWGAWIGPVLFAIVGLGSQLLLMMFITTLITRRMYVEVENLPFPVASAVGKLVEATQPTTTGINYFRSKYFWVAFIITFLYYGVPALGNIVSPSFKPINWYDNRFINLEWLYKPGPEWWGGWDFTVVLGGLFALMLWLSPVPIAFNYWMSTDILGTAIISYIILAALPFVFVGTGYWPMVPVADQNYSRFQKVFMFGFYRWGGNYQPAFYGSMIVLGCAAAMFLVPLIGLRHEIKPIFTGLFKAAPKEYEEKEPLPIRWQWIGIIVLAIIWFAWGLAVQTPWYVMLLMLLLVPLFHLGGLRFRAETGGNTGYWGFGGWLSHWGPGQAFVTILFLAQLAMGGWPTGTGTPADLAKLTPAVVATGFIWIWFAQPLNYQGIGTGNNIFGTAYSIIESFRIGAITKTRNRDIFVAGILAVIVAVVVSAFSNVFAIHSIDISGSTAGFTWAKGVLGIFGSYKLQAYTTPIKGYLHVGSDTSFSWDTPRPVNYWMMIPWFAGTFIVVAVIYMLRARGKAFGINPMGIMLAAVAYSFGFSAIIIAFALKYLTLRIGGTKLYEEKGLPITVAIITSYFLVAALFVFFNMIHAYGFLGYALWG